MSKIHAEMMQEALEALGLGTPPVAVNVPTPTPSPAQTSPPRPTQPATPPPTPLRPTQATGNSVPTTGASPWFVPPPWWTRFVYTMLAPGKAGCCLEGPRGSGKTTAPHELSRQTGIPLITYQASKGDTIESIVGNRDLVTTHGDLNSVFTPGPLPSALRLNCWLLIEEANTMHPGVFSKFNTLTDGSGDSLLLPDGVREHVGPDFRLILAFNEGYVGTNEINPALRDRLKPIYCDYMPQAVEERIVMDKMGCDAATARSLVNFANAIRAARVSIGFDFSPRAMFDMLASIRDLNATWSQALEWDVLDRHGNKYMKKPQRDSMTQIANMCGLEKWPMPKFSKPGWVCPTFPIKRASHTPGVLASDASTVETADDFETATEQTIDDIKAEIKTIKKNAGKPSGKAVTK